MNLNDQAPYAPGTPVEVRERFLGRWHDGFVVHDHSDGAVSVARLCDGTVLPAPFAPDEVRPASR